MKLLFILLFLAGCWNDPPDECYECKSPIMQDATFCGYTEDEMNNVIEWRKEQLNDTLICNKL